MIGITQVFHSARINLSPFTKDFRVWETPIENVTIFQGSLLGSYLPKNNSAGIPTYISPKRQKSFFCKCSQQMAPQILSSWTCLDMHVQNVLSINAAKRWRPRLQSKFFPFKLVRFLSKKEGFCRIFCAGMNCHLKRLHMSFCKANWDCPWPRNLSLAQRYFRSHIELVIWRDSLSASLLGLLAKIKV